MKLSKFFPPDGIVRDGAFDQTMHPRTNVPNSICYAESRFFLELALTNPNISTIITTPRLGDMVDSSRGLLVVDAPRFAFYQVHNHLVTEGLMFLPVEHHISPDSDIHPTAILYAPTFIDNGVSIGAYSVVGANTIIGANTHIGDHVVLSVRGMQNTTVNGRRFPLRYVGGVQIGKECEILTGAVIQKPYLAEFTEIGDGTVISVRTSIGHGSKVGQGVMIAGGVTVAGNCRIGDFVRIGPMAVISDGVQVGDNAEIKLGAVVVEDVPLHSSVSGNFAIPHLQQLRQYTRTKRGAI